MLTYLKMSEDIQSNTWYYIDCYVSVSVMIRDEYYIELELASGTACCAGSITVVVVLVNLSPLHCRFVGKKSRIEAEQGLHRLRGGVTVCPEIA